MRKIICSLSGYVLQCPSEHIVVWYGLKKPRGETAYTTLHLILYEKRQQHSKRIKMKEWRTNNATDILISHTSLYLCVRVTVRTSTGMPSSSAHVKFQQTPTFYYITFLLSAFIASKSIIIISFFCTIPYYSHFTYSTKKYTVFKESMSYFHTWTHVFTPTTH